MASSVARSLRPTRLLQLDLGLALPTTHKGVSREFRTLLALKVPKAPSVLMAPPALPVTSPAARPAVSYAFQRRN